jgi:hypothetical protein
MPYPGPDKACDINPWSKSIPGLRVLTDSQVVLCGRRIGFAPYRSKGPIAQSGQGLGESIVKLRVSETIVVPSFLVSLIRH